MRYLVVKSDMGSIRFAPVSDSPSQEELDACVQSLSVGTPRAQKLLTVQDSATLRSGSVALDFDAQGELTLTPIVADAATRMRNIAPMLAKKTALLTPELDARLRNYILTGADSDVIGVIESL